MKYVSLLSIAFAISACSTSRNGIPSHHTAIDAPKLEFSVKKPERFVLENGMTVYFQHDDEVPLISGTLYVRGGSLYEPQNLVGLASATGSQMREGGIQGLIPEALDRRLYSLGATVETSFSGEFGSFGFSGLSGDVDEVFQIFTEVVRRPAFNKERLHIWKKLAIDSIARRKDDPQTMASMTFGELIYGAGHSLSRASSLESISRINERHIRDFHKQFVRPNEAILVVSGDITIEHLKGLLEKHFADWREADSSRPSLQAVSHVIQPGIYVLERDFAQATILLGHRGPKRFTLDQYDITIFNRVFGFSGFESLLFSEIRSKLGLAYFIYGGISPGVVEGEFQVGLGTRVQESSKAIKRVFELISEVQKQPIEAVKIEDAKRATELSFVFRFSSPEEIANRQALLQLLEYPADYDETYLDAISRVTPETTLEVARKHVNPSELVVVVVGNVSPSELAREFDGVLPVYRVGFETAPIVAPTPEQVENLLSH